MSAAFGFKFFQTMAHSNDVLPLRYSDGSSAVQLRKDRALEEIRNYGQRYAMLKKEESLSVLRDCRGWPHRQGPPNNKDKYTKHCKIPLHDNRSLMPYRYGYWRIT